MFSIQTAREGSGVVRMYPVRLLAGCRKRRLNQALPIGIVFFDCVVIRATVCVLLVYVGCVLFSVVLVVVSTCQVIGYI